MSAPIGNQFWKQRSRHGIKALMESPEKLREACEKYFEWVEDNPLIEDKAFAYEGVVKHEEMEKMRAMTIDGLSIFLGIVPKTWYEWRNKRQDLSDVISWADLVIKNQKFTGAAAGLLNSNIIARDLALHDIKAIQQLDGDGNPVDVSALNLNITAGEDLVKAAVDAFEASLPKKAHDE